MQEEGRRKGTEGRQIGGEGLDHEQEYIRERIEQAGDTDEYAEASRQLQDELRDLNNLSAGSREALTSGQGQPQVEPGLEALDRQANLPTEGMELRQGADLDASRGSLVDPQQLPPDAEARARIRRGVGGGVMGEQPPTSSTG